MKIIWRFVFSIACCALVGFGSSLSSDAPLVKAAFPAGVEKVLPHAVLLWQSATLWPVREPRVMEFVGVADINSDGFLDIVCSHRTQLIVFFGDGTGQFSRNAACGWYETKETDIGGGWFRVDPLSDLTAQGAVIIDLDEDGQSEVIVGTVGKPTPTEPYGPWLYVFRNRAGCLSKAWSASLPFQAHFLAAKGSSSGIRVGLLAVTVEQDKARVLFLPRKDKFLFGSPVFLAAARGWPFFYGDVDGDSFYDLALRYREGLVILWGDGQGGFSRSTTLEPEDKLVWGAALGDLTGDRVHELVLSTPQGVIVLQLVNGEFVEISRYKLRWRLGAVRLADFTGDGQLDLLAMDSYGQGGTVLAGDGLGGFHKIGSEFWLGLPSSPHVVDLNRDGRADLLALTPHVILVWMNGGEPQGTSYLPIGGPYLLAAGDLSGNGWPDLVARHGAAVEVLWNNGHGALVREFLSELPRPGFLQHLVPKAAVVAERKVGVLLTEPEVEKGLVELRWLGPDGEELGAHQLVAKVLPILAAGELDGDANVDLVMVGEDGLLVLWGRDNALSRYSLPGTPTMATVADFTGDGLDDVAVMLTKDYAELVTVSLVGRMPVLSEVLLQFDMSVPLALCSADFNGDGTADPVAIAIKFTVDEAEGTVVISGAELGMYLSRVGASIYPILEFPEKDAPWPLAGLVAGEFTGDGLADLAYTTVSGAGVFLLPGRGDGTFDKPRYFSVPAGPVVSADLDRNGQDEVITSVQGGSPMIWILWNGGGR